MSHRAVQSKIQNPKSEIYGYDFVRTPIGLCGVCVGPRGVCRVMLPVGNRAAMERALRRGASPEVRWDPARCRRAVAAIARYFRTGRAGDAGPLDLNGCSALECATYAALRRVPPGTVVTYAGLARWAGHPGAARAVGGALGRNPLPLIIPCHRVVRSDGSVGGFSCPGGVSLKRRLLMREGYRA
jgi:methylated-DNA-[protein]-cysteine S-methyltransferase